MLFALHLAAFCPAFSSILHCIQRHFALRFAPFYLAFSTKTPCILHQNALRLASKHPKIGTNGGLYQINIHLDNIHMQPFSHQNKPSRESIFCGKMCGWWIKWALIMLKFLPKRLQRLVGQRVNRRAREQADKWAN